MSNELFGLGLEWEEEDGDTTPCAICQEPIYGKKYTCKLKVRGKLSELDSVICKDCYLDMNLDIDEEDLE